MKWATGSGLYHTSESTGTSFDPLSDTAECPISRDNDSDGKVYPEECDGYGADNVMFWTAWSTSSQAAGKKQETISREQKYVLKYSPIAKKNYHQYKNKINYRKGES
jgi:hypothetical protein